MAIGHIFYITTDPWQEVSFGESDYYEKLEMFGMSHVEDVGTVLASIPLKSLEDTMRGLGASIAYGYKGFAFTFSFKDAEAAKQQYFRPKLEKLRERVSSLTLSNIICQPPALDCILDDGYGNRVMLADGDCRSDIGFDGFIRQLKAGTTYYVYEKTVLMH